MTSVNNPLDSTIRKLGNGNIVKLSSGERIFKLSSFTENPIVKPQDLGLTWRKNGKTEIGAVFNPGAAICEDQIVLTPRCHANYEKIKFFDEKLGIERSAFENYISEIWILKSRDGIKFSKLSNGIIRGDGTEHKDFVYGIEDVRIIEYKTMYFLIGCGKVKPPFKGENADRVAIYTTKDFNEINYCGIISCFDSRNAVPIFLNDEEVYMLLRFYPHIYIAPLKAGVDQLLNPKDYEEEWKKIYNNRRKFLLLESGKFPHEKEKIGPGPPPIKTSEGWLLIYHAVGKLDHNLCKEYGLKKGIERGYSICAALLDLENPQKVLCRTQRPIYIPSKPYELWGNHVYPVDVPAVVFPTGVVLKDGKMLLYCGAGDKYVILLSCNMEFLLNFMMNNSFITG